MGEETTAALDVNFQAIVGCLIESCVLPVRCAWAEATVSHSVINSSVTNAAADFRVLRTDLKIALLKFVIRNFQYAQKVVIVNRRVPSPGPAGDEP
jgi:hypothetical protein